LLTFSFSSLPFLALVLSCLLSGLPNPDYRRQD